MATTGTGLRRIGRIHANHFSASLFRFALKELEELRPGRIGNAFRQLWILDQIADHQRLHRDEIVLLDDLAALLVGKVFATVLGALMDACDAFVKWFSSFRCLWDFIALALRFGQV